MKKAAVYTLVLLSIVICSFKTGKPGSNSDQLIKVAFNNKLTFDELVKIKDDLHQKHIDLTYKTLAFDEANHLTKIDFKVDCNDGFKGGAASDHLTSKSDFGFYRDYAKDASTPFGTGGM